MNYEKVLEDYTNGVHLTTMLEYSEYFKIIQNLIWDDEIEKYDDILLNINLEKSSLLMFVGILRTGYIKSEELQNYNTMLMKITREIENRNEDSHKLLHGLDAKLDEETKDFHKQMVIELKLNNKNKTKK